MLKEIYCEEFKEYGSVRKPIQLKNGLNVVIGEKKNGEENSIGKTTFLLIVDFCFGGDSYRSVDVVKALGHHKIFFTFSFDNDYTFCRSTAKDDELFRCDDKRNCLERMPLEKFKMWLADKYSLQAISKSIRTVISPYFRIFNKSLLEAGDFLSGYKGESQKEQIRNFQQLFDDFSSIREIVKKVDSYAAKVNLLANAKRKNIELQELQETESLENLQSRIEELRSKEKLLVENKSQRIDNLSKENTERLIQLKLKLKKLRSRRSCLEIKLRNIEIPKNLNRSEIENPYKVLLDFFPTANIQLLEDIEKFHNRFTESLKSDFEEFSEQIKNELKLVKSEIKQKESELINYDDYGNLAIPFLREYSTIQVEISECQKKIELQKKNEDELNDVNKKKKELLPLERSLMKSIQKSLNLVLENFSKNVFGQNHPMVTINFPTQTRATLNLNLDDGTGTKYTGEILFDLAMLKVTKIPAIVHDSFWLSNIRGTRIEKIFSLYNSFKEKQIFISIDEVEKYRQETQKILYDRKILSLGPNGGELFGRSFPKESVNKKF